MSLLRSIVLFPFYVKFLPALRGCGQRSRSRRESIERSLDLRGAIVIVILRQSLPDISEVFLRLEKILGDEQSYSSAGTTELLLLRRRDLLLSLAEDSFFEASETRNDLLNRLV
jgi:hypothetical protein